MARAPKLFQKISEKLGRRAPASIESAKKRFGWGNSEIAQKISGTSDKRSREYKNAMRRIQRAAQAGKVTPEIKKALNGEAERRAWKRVRRHGVSRIVIKSGTYWVSSDKRLNKKMGDGFGGKNPIGGARFAPVIEEIEAARIAEMTGNPEEAAEHIQNANDLLEELVSESYDMAGGQVAHFTEVGELDIDIR